MRRLAVRIPWLLLPFVLFAHAHGASLSELLGGNQALQAYRDKSKSEVWIKDLNTGRTWKILTRSGNDWSGGINKAGTRLVTMNGNRACAVNLDGSGLEYLTPANTSSPHLWMDSQGHDWITYTGEPGRKDQIGTTWWVRLEDGSNKPVESTRKKLVDYQYKSGINGTYLATSYGKSYLYNRNTRVRSPHLNSTQNCVGSICPAERPRMMYERDPGHNDVVISEWNESRKTARYIWQYRYSAGEVYGQWSVTNERYASITRSGQLYLVKLQVDTSGGGDNKGSYQEAAMGITQGYVGGVWIGGAAGANRSPTASISSPAGGTVQEGDPIAYGGWASDAEDGSLSGSNLKWEYDILGDGLGNSTIGTGKSGSFTAPAHPKDTYPYTLVIYLTASDSLGATHESSVQVTVDRSVKPSITVLSPNGGVAWAAGSTQTIRWQAENITDVTIFYSTDRGATWTLVAGSVDDTQASWQSYPWIVPDAPSGTCLVRVKGYFDEASDVSDGTFEITSGGGPDTTPPALAVKEIVIAGTVDDPSATVAAGPTLLAVINGRFSHGLRLSGVPDVVLTTLDAAGNRSSRKIAVSAP